MLLVNKISICRPNQQQQQLYNKNVQQTTFYNTYCLSQQPVAFTGKYGTFKEVIINKYLTFRLKKVLRECDLICQNLDKNNSNFKGDILSDKCKNLLNYVAKKTKTMLIHPLIEIDFSKIKILTAEQGINLSSKQKTELFKRFNLSKTRKKITNNAIESLEFLKNSKLFESSSNIIQNAINKMSRAIRCVGLAEEVKNIVIKSEDNLGVKLDIPDSPDLAKNIYSCLAQHKIANLALPKEISFNDFVFFTTHNPALSASYVSGIKPGSPKQIYLNPIFLISRQDKNDSSSVIEDLEHELGHFWHNLKIGDRAFHSKRMNSLDGFLSIEENNFLLDLKNKLSEKVCFVPNLDLTGRVNEDLSEIIPDLQNMINHRQDLEIEDILTKENISKFNQIIQNLNELTSITSKNFPDCPDEVVYALTSPKELIAFAIQKRHRYKYDPAFLEMLKRFGMPDLKN